MSKILINIPELYEGIITKRPSKYCKTPYVGDLLLINEEDKNDYFNNSTDSEELQKHYMNSDPMQSIMNILIHSYLYLQGVKIIANRAHIIFRSFL